MLTPVLHRIILKLDSIEDHYKLLYQIQQRDGAIKCYSDQAE